MKRTSKNNSSARNRSFFIVFALFASLCPTTGAFGQCQGFVVGITLPPAYSICPGDIITVPSYVIGGTAPYTYSWSTGGTGPVETIIAPQNGFITVSLTVVDANGCVAISNSGYIKPMFAHTYVEATSTPDCKLFILTVHDMPIGSTFLWSNGETTNPIFVTDPGDYSVKVTSPPCSIILPIKVDPIPVPEPEITGSTSICPYGDGTLSVSGGPFDSYFWNPTGETTQEIQISSPGIYSVRVTDEYGCTGSDSIVIDAIPVIQPTFSTPPILCPGGEGAIGVINQADYMAFSWSTGESTPGITGHAPGAYEVTVTDFNGCTQIGTVSLDNVFDVLYPNIVHSH